MNSLRSHLMLAVGLLVFNGCSEQAGNGQNVAIPRVIVNCQAASCRANFTPIIAISITSSSCSARAFGEVAAKTTRSINCTSIAGCYGEPSDSWYAGTGGSAGVTTTVASGTYTICACLNYSSAAIPWTACDKTGEVDNVFIDGATGVTTITSWN